MGGLGSRNHSSGLLMLRAFCRTAGRIKRYLVPPPPTAAVTLAQMFGGRPAVVVQVGSNDGLQGDPIAALIRQNSAWSALFGKGV